jgi:hypothetical protein
MARLGDTTSHGGKIVEAALDLTDEGVASHSTVIWSRALAAAASIRSSPAVDVGTTVCVWPTSATSPHAARR